MIKGEERCWKRGTAWVHDPDLGPYCPAKVCDVADAVLLSPDEHAERLASYPGLRLCDPVALMPGDGADLAAFAAAAEAAGRALMVKVLR